MDAAAYERLAAAAQEAEALQAEYAGVFDPVAGLLGEGVIVGPYGVELLQRVHALAVRASGALAGLRGDIEDELARTPVPHGCRPFAPVAGPVRGPLEVSDAGWPAHTVGIYPGRAKELITRIGRVAATVQTEVAERALQICHAADMTGTQAFAAGETGAELADLAPQVQARLDAAEQASAGHLLDAGSPTPYSEQAAQRYLAREEARQAASDARALRAVLAAAGPDMPLRLEEIAISARATNGDRAYRDALADGAAGSLAGLASALDIAHAPEAQAREILAAFATAVAGAASDGSAGPGSPLWKALAAPAGAWSAGTLLAAGPGGTAYGKDGGPLLAAVTKSVLDAEWNGTLAPLEACVPGRQPALTIGGLSPAEILGRAKDNTTALMLLGPLIARYAGRVPQGMTVADANITASFVRGLIVLSSSYRRYLQDKWIPHLNDEFTKASSNWDKLLNARMRPDDPEWLAARAARHEALINLQAAKNDLPIAERNEKALARLLDTRVEDIPAAETLVPDDEEGVLGKVIKFGLDTPILDFASAAVGTFLSAKDDMAHGQAWYEAYPKEAAANFGGVALGAAAAEGTTALVASFGGSVAAGVAVGAAVGGLVAVGAGEFLHYAIDENWAADWDKYGVLGGTGHGIADSFDKSRHDMAHLGDDLLGAGRKVWDDIF